MEYDFARRRFVSRLLLQPQHDLSGAGVADAVAAVVGQQCDHDHVAEHAAEQLEEAHFAHQRPQYHQRESGVRHGALLVNAGNANNKVGCCVLDISADTAATTTNITRTITTWILFFS